MKWKYLFFMELGDRLDLPKLNAAFEVELLRGDLDTGYVLASVFIFFYKLEIIND